MKNQKDFRDPVGNYGEFDKKPQKQDVNLQKNTTLYFQLGLIICLLITYGLLEMKFEQNLPQSVQALSIDEDFAEISIENFKVYQKPQPERLQPNTIQEVKLIDEIDVVDDDFDIDKDLNVLADDELVPDDSVDPNELHLEDKPEETNVPINFIQNVPIYPGCEYAQTNYERRKCMSDQISKLIKRKFDGADIASNYGLTGRQRIFVRFTIDKTGRVNEVETRAPNEELGNEAKRVINMMPKMTPGRQNNKNVGVIYNLPITFQVE